MKKNANKELRTFATQAKKRLASGFYDRKVEQMKKAINYGTINGINLDDITASQRQVVKREILLTQSKEQQADELFYQKVCDIIKQDSDAIDPIGKLVDKEYFSKLDSTQQQKYILELSAKYRAMSERYHAESKYC